MYAHTDPLFQSLRILKLEQMYVCSVQLFMYKFLKKELPEIFENFFERNDTNHDYPTRWGMMYRIPMLRTFPADRSIRLRGVHIFNYFLQHLTSESLYVTYKFALKNYIINNNVSYEDCLPF